MLDTLGGSLYTHHSMPEDPDRGWQFGFGSMVFGKITMTFNLTENITLRNLRHNIVPLLGATLAVVIDFKIVTTLRCATEDTEESSFDISLSKLHQGVMKVWPPASLHRTQRCPEI
jgi:hypothetical protein